MSLKLGREKDWILENVYPEVTFPCEVEFGDLNEYGERLVIFPNGQQIEEQYVVWSSWLSFCV